MLSCQSVFEKTETSSTPFPVKVVVVTMFENGDATGDRPGEFQYWVERFPLDSIVDFPAGYRELRLNADKGVLGVVTGVGTAKAAATTMALGLDSRFDLSKAYWLVAGISGVDPNDASVGSAAWAEWIVDGDLSHQIDAREIPEDWETGYIPLRLTEPYEKPVPERKEGVLYHLRPSLVDWAYQLTADVDLVDNDAIQKFRSLYTKHPNAQQPPRVLKGDQLAATTYWHGELLNEWANNWVIYWTKGSGNFVTSAMEDTGTLQSLTFLDNAGKADIRRVLVLRTASNFTMQYPGVTAAESLSGEELRGKGYTAYIPSLEAAYRVGNVVVQELVQNWETYRDGIP